MKCGGTKMVKAAIVASLLGIHVLRKKVKSLIVGPELTCYMPGQAIKDCQNTSQKTIIY